MTIALDLHLQRAAVERERRASEGRSRLRTLLPYLVVVAAYALVHGLIVGSGASPVLRGELIDTDSYLHLLVAAELHETGDWFDRTLERSNAPYGEILHTTRPFDILLLAGAWAAAPFLGFRDALYWSGALISPALHVVLALIVAWAARPFLSREARVIAMLLLLAQPGLLDYAAAGRADHHLLIMVLFAASLGLTLRLLRRHYDRRLALVAGATAGLGLWVSVEFLVPLAVAFAATAVIWLRYGGDEARKNAWYAAGLTAAVGLAVLAERGIAGLAAVEYDRVSVVHLAVALIALGFWSLIARFGDLTRLPKRAAGRVIVAAAGAGAAVALLLLTFPKFFAGPLADLDPRLAPVFLHRITELQPLLPTDAVTLGKFLMYIGASVAAVPHVAWRLVAERRGARWPLWLYLAVALAVFLPLTLLQIRFMLYVEILAVLAAVDLVFGYVWPRLGRLRPVPLRVLARSGAGAGLLCGFNLAGFALAAPAVGGAAPSGVCPVQELAVYLNSPDGYGDRPRTILASINHGSELLYRTGHRTIASASHRNSAGILAVYDTMAAADPDESLRIVRLRGVDLILLCPTAGERAFFTPPGDTDVTLYGRLLDGSAPDWLRPVDLPPDLADAFELYEVVNGRAP